jgi:hypothetical protein
MKKSRPYNSARLSRQPTGDANVMPPVAGALPPPRPPADAAATRRLSRSARHSGRGARKSSGRGGASAAEGSGSRIFGSNVHDDAATGAAARRAANAADDAAAAAEAEASYALGNQLMVGRWVPFSPRSFHVTTLSHTRERLQPQAGVWWKTPTDDGRYSPCNQSSDTRE